MVLLELHLRSAPGLPHGLTLTGLDSGLVLLYGPNASGKSTIGRTLRGGLWPDQAPPGVDAQTRWRSPLDGLVYQATTVFGRTQWDQDGAPLPPAEVAEAARFTLRALLESADGSTAAIAQQVRLELDGGYDVDGLALVAKPRVRPLPSVTKPRREAEDALAAALGKADALAHDESRLATLHAEVTEAAEAPQRLAVVRRAQQAQTAREAVAALAPQLAAMQDVHRALTPEAAGRLTDLVTRIDEAEQELEAAEGAQRDAQAAVDEASFPTATPLETVLEKLVERARTLDQDRADLEQQRAELEALEAEREACAQQVWSGQATASSLSQTDLQDLEAATTALATARARHEALAPPPEQADPPLATSARETLEEGQHLLRQWLKTPERTPAPTAKSSSAVHFLVLLAGGALVLLGLVLAFLLSPVAGLIVAGVGLGLCGLWVGRMWGRASTAAPPAPASDARALAERFSSLQLARIDDWTVSGVTTALRTLEAQRSADDVSRQAQATARAHRQRASRLQQAVTKADAALQETVARLGLSPDLAGAALIHQAQRLGALATAEVALSKARTHVSATAKACASEASALARQLGGLELDDLPPLDDPDSLLPAAQAVLRRHGRLAAAEQQLSDRETVAQQARTRADRERSALQESLKALGLVESELERLPELLAQAETWRALAAEQQQHLDDLERLERDLPADLPEDLASEAARLETLTARHQALADQQADIRRKIQAATEAGTITEALAQRAAAEELLARDREQQLVAHAGQALKAWMQQERRANDMPKLLERAQAWFLAFTHNRYEIDVHVSSGFVARDLHTGALQQLAELSDGTRIQLLLACRLAYLEEAEGDTKTPLFLDEVLSTTDPERFTAVAGAVMALCRQGRQVFYATSDPAEVQAWRQAAHELGYDPPQVQTLASSGPTTPWTDAPSLPEPRPALPALDDHDAVSWSTAAGLSRPGLWDDAAQWPLALVLWDDLETAHAAARIGVTRAGQLALADSGVPLGMAPEPLARARARLRVIEAVLTALRIGRSLPVTWSIIEESGAVTAAFTERIQEKLPDHGHDAAAFIQATHDIKGFRKTARARLVEHLQAAGILDERERLPHDGVVLRAQQASAADQTSGRLDVAEVQDLTRWCTEVVQTTP